MNHWLVKTEPDEYSYQMLQRQGRCAWTGVRNNLALKYLRLMKADDQVLVYHTGSEKSCGGPGNRGARGIPRSNRCRSQSGCR